MILNLNFLRILFYFVRIWNIVTFSILFYFIFKHILIENLSKDFSVYNTHVWLFSIYRGNQEKSKLFRFFKNFKYLILKNTFFSKKTERSGLIFFINRLYQNAKNKIKEANLDLVLFFKVDYIIIFKGFLANIVFFEGFYESKCKMNHEFRIIVNFYVRKGLFF